MWSDYEMRPCRKCGQRSYHARGAAQCRDCQLGAIEAARTCGCAGPWAYSHAITCPAAPYPASAYVRTPGGLVMLRSLFEEVTE